METQFDKDEFSFAYPDGIENNYWNIARNKTILQTIKKHGLSNILDVGSGRGIVPDFLHKNNIQINGVELGKTTPISNSNVQIFYNTDATTLPKEASAAYKTISLFDVIEHIEQPVNFMKNLVSHFENAEHLIITVPARKELWTNFDEYYGHFKRYDLKIIAEELDKVNFKIVEARYFFHSLYLIIRLNNLVSRKRKIQFSAPTGIAKIVHKVAGTIFYLEKFVCPPSFYGSSIICVAKRK